jgi:hypothetical protein
MRQGIFYHANARPDTAIAIQATDAGLPGGTVGSRTGVPMIRSSLLLLALAFLIGAGRAMFSEADDRDSVVLGYLVLAIVCMGLGAVSH